MFIHVPVAPPPKLKQVTAADGTRYYENEAGRRYESTTTYIGRNWDKKFLDAWRKRVGEAAANSISSAATTRGSRLHSTIEAYLLNDVAYRSILQQHVLTRGLFAKIKPHLNLIQNIRLLEKSLYSDELGLAGSPDCIAEYDDVLSTIDFKTSTKEKAEKWIQNYWLQIAIYSKMFEELYGEMPAQSVIIMAVEDHPLPLIFKESSYQGQQRLAEFMSDPVKFQKDQDKHFKKIAEDEKKARIRKHVGR